MINTIIKDISPEDVKKMMDDKEDFVLIDVRNPDEYLEGHIPGAYNIPILFFVSTVQDVYPDKNKKYVLYCSIGKKAARAAMVMEKLGYTDISNMGGINDWTYDISTDRTK
ncbi:MAG: rhodanese-like domain-containing protein [Lachnospiraceae bacterium]|jgi:rhodanese-related sulfurtransferase|nr:rhodanese-like domain-containing protein [Lachnospiraceae bacterium]